MNSCSKLYLLFLLFFSHSLLAEDIVRLPMDEAKWEYKGSNLKCELKYGGNKSGKFYFRSEERGQTYLYMALVNSGHELTNGQLYGHPAPWQDEVAPLLITEHFQQTKQQLIFTQGIGDLIGYIERGGWVKVSAGGSAASARRSYLFPTVRIHPLLRHFIDCQKALPLMSYSRAKDISLSFNIGQKALDTNQLNTLTALNSYLNADPSVTKILLDGHTDSSGSNSTNLALSRLRASLVGQELQRLGIGPQMIEVRAHGARYPIASNASPIGQAKNRRVTIRLVRNNQTVVPVTPHQNNTKKVQ